MVLDFANESDDIQAAFQPYFETTVLSEATDPNLLYEIQTRLKTFAVYMQTRKLRILRPRLLRRRDYAGPALCYPSSRGSTLL